MRGDFVYGDYVYVDDYYMDEDWEFINGFPGYMISNKGRVWSSVRQQFLSPRKMDRQGHLGFCLSVDGHKKYVYLHRLIAEAFIPNPMKYPIVRHLNDQRDDNTLNNLAWGTQKDNHRDCLKNGNVYYLSDEDREIGFKKTRKPVVATDLDTGESVCYRSQTDAARELGLQQANINKVLLGQRSHTCGYTFEFLNKEEYCDECY